MASTYGEMISAALAKSSVLLAANWATKGLSSEMVGQGVTVSMDVMGYVPQT